MTYTLYFPDKIKRDVANFGAVVDKFTEDAFVEYGILRSDDWETVKIVKFQFGGIDKNCKCICEVGFEL